MLLAAMALPAQAQDAGRLVRVFQVDKEGKPVVPGFEVLCPISGCQEPLTVELEGAKEQYIAAIDVVSRGIYIALDSRTVGTAAILDFNTGRPGPTFVATRGRERVERVLPFIVVRDASVRAERGFDPKRDLNQGSVFTRTREPDLLLHVEIVSPDE